MGKYVPLSSGHRVIDITNGHFIHAGPLEGIGVSIYLHGKVRKHIIRCNLHHGLQQKGHGWWRLVSCTNKRIDSFVNRSTTFLALQCGG
jgi:hypothetical protein